MATLVRWAGPDVTVKEGGARTVEYTLRLAALTWPHSAHLRRALEQDALSANAQLSLRALPPVFSGSEATSSVHIDANRAQPGHYIVSFALSAGDAAPLQFPRSGVVFDEFLVRPDEETLQRAFRWAQDVPAHQVRDLFAPRLLILVLCFRTLLSLHVRNYQPRSSLLSPSSSPSITLLHKGKSFPLTSETHPRKLVFHAPMSRFLRASPKAQKLATEQAPSALCFEPAALAKGVMLETVARSFHDCFGTRQYHHVRVAGPPEAAVPFVAYNYTVCHFAAHRDALVASGMVVFVTDHRVLRVVPGGACAASARHAGRRARWWSAASASATGTTRAADQTSVPTASPRPRSSHAICTSECQGGGHPGRARRRPSARPPMTRSPSGSAGEPDDEGQRTD